MEYEYPVAKEEFHNYNVPCAVCFTQSRGAKLMIPAALTCPQAWTKEYEGYLMSVKNTHGASTFECVDSDVEAIDGSEANTNGGLFYNVEVQCDRELDCDCKYHEEKELSCVVCTR